MNFALDNGITLARALYVAGAASAFGVNVAEFTYARGTLGLRRWAVGGAVIATGAGLAWLALLTFTLADAPTWPAWREALPAVAYDTRFGQALLAGLALLACSTFTHPIPAAMLAGAAVALHAVATHATATEGEIGTVVEATHLLAACRSGVLGHWVDDNIGGGSWASGWRCAAEFVVAAIFAASIGIWPPAKRSIDGRSGAIWLRSRPPGRTSASCSTPWSQGSTRHGHCRGRATGTDGSQART